MYKDWKSEFLLALRLCKDAIPCSFQVVIVVYLMVEIVECNNRFTRPQISDFNSKTSLRLNSTVYSIYEVNCGQCVEKTHTNTYLG